MSTLLVSVSKHQPTPEPPRQEVGNGRLHPLTLARIHRDAAHLQALGPRAVAEALIEFATGPQGPDAVLHLLGRYNRLSQVQIVTANADRPLPSQLMLVPR